MKKPSISQKRFVTCSLLFFVLGTVAMAAFSVEAGGQTIVDPEPLNTIIYPPAEITRLDPALHSLAAMYAPMDNHEIWIRSVCMGMTQSGCAYFKAHQAAAVWDGQLGHAGSSAGYLSNTTVVDETHEMWTVTTSIFTQGPNDKHSTETTFDVYILVERGADQKWYLDRVLIGPSIDLEPSDQTGWNRPHIET